MKNILFLAVRMSWGFGVSVEIHHLATQLASSGIRVVTGCLETDRSFNDIDIEQIDANPDTVRALARGLEPCVIVAHTSPFFEMLPQLCADHECWAWENGDPTPALFDTDAQERENTVQHKRREVYPRVDRIIAISEFIKHDIGIPDAHVIYCGCDHVPEMPAKTADSPTSDTTRPLKIGALMRLGPGEARYKGNQAFIDLVDQLRVDGIPVEAHVAGRGTDEDAQSFIDRDMVTHLNISEHAKYEYLRDLDIFASLSQWEGFNLPLVEAQAMGTLSFCLDMGAHPEVCPFVVSHLADLPRFIRRAHEDRQWLIDKSALCYRFVRTNFRWAAAAQSIISLLDPS